MQQTSLSDCKLWHRLHPIIHIHIHIVLLLLLSTNRTPHQRNLMNLVQLMTLMTLMPLMLQMTIINPNRFALHLIKKVISPSRLSVKQLLIRGYSSSSRIMPLTSFPLLLFVVLINYLWITVTSWRLSYKTISHT